MAKAVLLGRGRGGGDAPALVAVVVANSGCSPQIASDDPGLLGQVHGLRRPPGLPGAAERCPRPSG